MLLIKAQQRCHENGYNNVHIHTYPIRPKIP
jgi:hypothetical protein